MGVGQGVSWLQTETSQSLGPALGKALVRDRAYLGSTVRTRSLGMVKLNVLPRPSSLSTQMLPPWSSTSALLMASPRPVPAADLVVELSTRKNF